ncbi:helix-turn-helix domain-containing protein [Plantactinospora sp. WMMB334]|uniref:helix-turn-helix domain-containing protein n=1 Tax=Plantactinospora sp. WMMB334 TaxID=3404119 RepID=UPI003B9552BB
MTTPGRPLLGVQVAGFPAVVLAWVLDGALPQRLQTLDELVALGRLDPGRVVEVRRVHEAIRAAAAYWRESSAVDGSTAERVAAIPEGSTSTEIDTVTAAELLGVSPNRVRQLARSGQVNGRHVGRSWWIDRNSVEARRLAAHEQQ